MKKRKRALRKTPMKKEKKMRGTSNVSSQRLSLSTWLEAMNPFAQYISNDSGSDSDIILVSDGPLPPPDYELRLEPEPPVFQPEVSSERK